MQCHFQCTTVEFHPTSQSHLTKAQLGTVTVACTTKWHIKTGTYNNVLYMDWTMWPF